MPPRVGFEKLKTDFFQKSASIALGRVDHLLRTDKFSRLRGRRVSIAGNYYRAV